MNNNGYSYPWPRDPPPPYPQATGRVDDDVRVTPIAAQQNATATGMFQGESTEPPPPYYAVDVPLRTLGNVRTASSGVHRHEVGVTMGVTVVTQPDYSRESYKCHAVLACFVLWSGNCFFGLISYILAVHAERTKRVDLEAARRLGRGSLMTSISGLVITATVVGLILSRTRLNCHSAYYTVNGHCYAYRRYVLGEPGCAGSFSTCCERYESVYYDGYCFGYYPGLRPITSTTSTTTATLPPTCLPELYVSGRCFRSRRKANRNWSCRGRIPRATSCCNSNEFYTNGYCYS